MAVVVETTLGDITVDLFLKERPKACQNFLKLCKLKYYNYNLFHTVSSGFIAQTGDPTGTRHGGESIFGVLEGPLKRFFLAETNPRIKHTIMGLVSFVGNGENMIGSQFFFTLGDELTYLDEKHCVFGQVTEGLDVLELINEAICDTDDRPYQDIRITHTVILDDPLPDLPKMVIPSRSPSPSAERLQGGRIAPDEDIDETAGKSLEEVHEMAAEREARARATILEMVGDIPDADMAPPENVLFVCKLNPVTTEDDLEIIFSRFGKIKSCEVIKDHKTGDSLQYAFVEFEEQKSCEDAYFKMDNVLIDDRRIHVDFSQSVSKIKWMGKGRGVKHFNQKDKDVNNGNRNKRINRSRSRSIERKNKKDNRNERSKDSRENYKSYNERNYSRRDDQEDRRYRSDRNRSRNNYDVRKEYRDVRNRDSRSYKERSKERYRRDRSSSVESKDRRKYENSSEHKNKNYSREHKYDNDSDESKIRNKTEKRNVPISSSRDNYKSQNKKRSFRRSRSLERRRSSSSSSSSSSDDHSKRSKKKKKNKERSRSSSTSSEERKTKTEKSSKKLSTSTKSKKRSSSSDTSDDGKNKVSHNKKKKY